MTDRLYYSDSYLTEFEATVVELGDDRRTVYLDRTAFYPTSGGQQHDLGTLGGSSIVDVIDEGERIAHRLESALDTPTGAIQGKIDRVRRLDHMQQHTGQHLLSAVFEDLFGFKTVSVHFGARYSTLDLDTESLGSKQLTVAEARANTVVGENRPVTVSFEDAAAASGLRKPPDRAGALRIVTIDGVDRSACGGTHVRSTGEIGPVLLRSTERVRKTTRVEFICGERALRQARADFQALGRIASSLSTSVDDLVPVVEAQSVTLRDAEQHRRKLERELASYRARDLYDRTAVDSGGRRVIVIPGPASMDEVKTLAQAILTLPNAVILGAVSDPPSVLLASTEDSGVDAGKTLKEAITAAGGRGGGSPRIAQGSVPDAGAATRLVSSLCLVLSASA